MFGFLKDKLKKAIGAFSGAAKDEVKEEIVEQPKPVAKAPVPQKKEAPKKESPKSPVSPEPSRRVTPPVPEKKPAPTKEPALAKPEPKPVPVKPVPVVEKPTPAARLVEKSVPAKPLPAKQVPAAQPVPAKPVEKTAPAKPALPAAKPLPPKAEKTEKELSDAVRGPSTADVVRSSAPVSPAPPSAPEKKGFFGRMFGKKEVAPEVEKAVAAETVAVPAPEVHIPVPEEPEDPEAPAETFAEAQAEYEAAGETSVEEPGEEAEEEPTGFFGKLREAVTKRTLSPEKFEEIFWELELAMLENNVAVEVIEKIKQDMKDELTTGKVSRMDLEGQVTARLKRSIEELFAVPTFDLIQRIKQGGKPYKICIIGVNGSGKTTSLAKLIHLFQKHKLSVVVAASDTFRAAAIDQLNEHTTRLGVKLISQGYNADPAAVAFDAIKHAEAKGNDVVLIDTAGRLHSNTNLMAELEKVVRVAKPDLKIFVGEAITGNDCVEQARVFDELVGIDGIILSKADVDEKGGAAISVSYVTGKPILYLGTGQTYDDLVPFDKRKIIEAVGL